MSQFGPAYHKIDTLFKRDDRGVIIPEEFTKEEFEYLADAPWRCTEKIDGTNIRLHWNGTEVVIGGRTDNAQLPANLVTNLQPFLNPAVWSEVFDEDGDAWDVTVYGEGFGAGIQKGAAYGEEQSFIVFDVKVGEWWMKPDAIDSIAKSLGFPVVPLFGCVSLWDAIRAVQTYDNNSHLQSAWEGVKIEGLVATPLVPLFDRRGRRIITKIKVRDFEDLRKRGLSNC